MSVKHVAIFAAALGLSGFASATVIDQILSTGRATVTPLINAGAPPDTPAARVDPNVPSSAFNGVVSINIRYMENGQQLSFICSGTMITPTHAVTAGHCIDTTGNGNVIDITKPGNDVRVILNASSVVGSPGRAVITASKVFMNPNYNGFGVCPPGSSSEQCLNDDVAIIRLSQAVPDNITKYAISGTAPGTDSIFTMVGYGVSGTGLQGYTLPPDFRIKRSGANVFDLFDNDDEQNFSASSPMEVWYYDFDGTKDGFDRDTFCILFGVCSAQLANSVETHLGGGDSGGPSFMRDAMGNYFLVANNTFGGNFCGWPGESPQNPCLDGDFGDFGGGVLLYSYLPWIHHIVPEPGALGLFALALLMMLSAASRRSRR